MRYCTEDNFVGTKIDGYKSSVAVLTKEAASALKNVQDELRDKSYTLVVYDAYRSPVADEHIKRWLHDVNDQSTKPTFYPNIQKPDIPKHGYIKIKSPYNRGSTVALTLMLSCNELKPINEIKRVTDDGSEFVFRDDGTADMGSSFDLFDEASNHNSSKIPPQASFFRNILRETMMKHGFVPSNLVWWEYTLAKEPFPDTSFDFDIEQ